MRLSHGLITLNPFALVTALVAVIVTIAPAWASPRSWQPLLLRGKQLPQLLNVPVRRIEVLAVHHGKLEPIPFQVDSVLTGNMYDLPQGPNPTAAEGVQAIGPEDEISMMMFDLGERVAGPDELPAGSVEISVADPLGGPRRYAYMASVNHPRRSANHYVDYDPEHEIIETGHYRLGFKNEFPGDFRLQDRKGEMSPNLIKGFQLRGSITVLNLFKVHLTEADVNSRLLAYKAGPVRVIRRVGHRIQVFKPIQSPEVSTVEFFYRDFGQAPFTMRLPLRKLFRDVRGTIAMDFVDLRGYALLASSLDQPLEIGQGTAALIDDRPAKWLALRGHGRLMLQTFAPSPDLDLIERELYYRPQPCQAEAASCTGIAAAVGLQTDGWQRLAGGPHRFNPLLISVPEDYGARRAIEETSVAPVVTVRAAKPGAAASAGAQSSAVVSTAPLVEPGK